MRHDKSELPTRTTLDLKMIDPARQFDYFCEEVGRRYARHERKKKTLAKDFPALIRTFDVRPMHCTLIDSPSLSGQRTKEHIRADDRQDLFLKLVVSGVLKVRTGDRTCSIGPGFSYLANYGQPFDFEVTSKSANTSVLAVRLRPADYPDVTSLEALFFENRFLHHKLAPLFKMTLTQLSMSMRGANDREIGTLVSVVESLVALMASDKAFRIFRPDTGQSFEVLEAEIERQLEDANMSLRSIAHQLGTSTRHIQRLLASHGTCFSDFVREKRLMLAMNRLRDTDCANKSIEGIAYTCGFSELSSFYRAFKRMFHCTPGDARRGADLSRESLYVQSH